MTNILLKNNIYNSCILRTLGVLVICLSIIPTYQSHAQNTEAGKVVFLQGDAVAINKMHMERKLAVNGILYSGDLIRTEADGRIQFRLKDNSFMALVPNSEFLIRDYSYKEQNKNDRGLFNLIKGGLRTLSGMMRKERFEIETPISSIGLRGTWFNAQLMNPEQLIVTVGYDPFDPTGVELKNSAGSLILNRGESGIVNGANSLPKLTSIQTSSVENSLLALGSGNRAPKYIDRSLEFPNSNVGLDRIVNHKAFESSGLNHVDTKIIGNNIPASDIGTFSNSELSIISEGCINCEATVSGMFTGDDINGPLSAGLVYDISDSSEGITGAAVFKRD